MQLLCARPCSIWVGGCHRPVMGYDLQARLLRQQSRPCAALGSRLLRAGEAEASGGGGGLRLLERRSRCGLRLLRAWKLLLQRMAHLMGCLCCAARRHCRGRCRRGGRRVCEAPAAPAHRLCLRMQTCRADKRFFWGGLIGASALSSLSCLSCLVLLALQGLVHSI
jgi:hypothetical protein